MTTLSLTPDNDIVNINGDTIDMALNEFEGMNLNGIISNEPHDEEHEAMVTTIINDNTATKLVDMVVVGLLTSQEAQVIARQDYGNDVATMVFDKLWDIRQRQQRRAA